MIQPNPFEPVEPVEPIKPGLSVIPMSDLPPQDMIHEDVVRFLIKYLQQHGSNRGAFKLERGEGNQQLPGVSLPPWLITAINMLSGHPAMPYNHDRQSYIRDALFMATMAHAQVLTGYDGQNPELKFTLHIIRQEEAFRRELYVQEMLMNFVEDLGIVCGMIELKIKAGARDAVYRELERLFAFVSGIEDIEFWRPTILRFMVRTPEIQDAMKYVGEKDTYFFDTSYQAWKGILDAVQERDERDED